MRSHRVQQDGVDQSTRLQHSVDDDVIVLAFELVVAAVRDCPRGKTVSPLLVGEIPGDPLDEADSFTRAHEDSRSKPTRCLPLVRSTANTNRPVSVRLR